MLLVFLPVLLALAEIQKLDQTVADMEREIKRIHEMKRMVSYIRGRRLVTFRTDAFQVIRQGILTAQADRAIALRRANGF